MLIAKFAIMVALEHGGLYAPRESEAARPSALCPLAGCSLGQRPPRLLTLLALVGGLTTPGAVLP